MNGRIAQALTKLFARHRIVFWYDAKQELRDDFEALSMGARKNYLEAVSDDEVKVNYLKFGAALKKIPGLDAEED